LKISLDEFRIPYPADLPLPVLRYFAGLEKIVEDDLEGLVHHLPGKVPHSERFLYLPGFSRMKSSTIFIVSRRG
jgi:hypothetical protein